MATLERSQCLQTAKEFADYRKRAHEWCPLKGQTHGVLGKRCYLRCGQPMSVDLDHRLSGGQEKRRKIGVEPASVTVCNIIIFLCQHLGMAPEEGAYLLDKMSDPAYKPPIRFRLALRLQNGGRICGTLRYIPQKM